MKALSPRELVAARVDLQRAAAIAFSIAVRDGAAGRRAKFVKLAEAGFFEIAALDELRMGALAAWYARAEQVRIGSLSTDAKVPEAVLRDAMELRGRMLRLLPTFSMMMRSSSRDCGDSPGRWIPGPGERSARHGGLV